MLLPKYNCQTDCETEECQRFDGRKNGGIVTIKMPPHIGQDEASPAVLVSNMGILQSQESTARFDVVNP